MVENKGKLQFLFFWEDALYKPSGRQVYLPVKYGIFPSCNTFHAEPKTGLKGILDLMFYCYAFIFKSWTLMG